MPYMVQREGSSYNVYKQNADGNPTGKRLGSHPSRASANRQLRALYANTDTGKSMSNLLERKAFKSSVSVEDEAKGQVHIIASAFGNKDSDNDIVVKGAFADSIKEGKSNNSLPPGIWMHDLKMPVARTEDAYEANDGLHVIGQFNMKTTRGRDAFYDIEQNVINKYSFGYKATEVEHKSDARHILRLKWYEWSPVLIPANSMTSTVSAKDGLSSKSQYLGKYAEENATISAIRSVTDALMYQCLYDCIRNYSDPWDDDDDEGEEGEDLETRLSTMEAALGEYSALVLKVTRAILSGTADESAEGAMKSIKLLFSKPGSKEIMLPAGMRLGDQLESTLGLMKSAVDRTKSYIQTKSEDGGKFPTDARREQILRLTNHTEELLKELKSLRLEPAKVDHSLIVQQLARTAVLQAETLIGNI